MKMSSLVACCMSVVTALTCGAPTCFAEDGVNSPQAVYELRPVPITESVFPDPNFRAVISEPNYDNDGDGVLSSDELIELRNIWCVGMGISSLKGIERLPELRGLYCMNNNIKTMDLSKNKELIGVWCSGNKFTSLDFTPNPKLEWVYCFDCNITSLNVSNNSKISYIECNSNPLKKLDVTNNSELEHLMCGDCGLTTLDLSHNPNLQHLDAFRNKFKTLDVTGCPRLKRLDIWDNPSLGSIDITHNTGLQYYNCANNDVTGVDVSHNPELTKLSVAYNDIKTLDLSKNPKLVYLDCADNQLTSLDVSKNNKLHYLQAFINDFTTLDIGYNPLLIKTYKEGTTDDVFGIATEWTIDYGFDDSTGGDSKYLLSFDDKVKLSAAQKYTLPDKAEVIIPDGASTKDLITREAAVQTLYDMAGRPAVSGSSRFTDVQKGAWYEKALVWGEKNKICVGTPEVSSSRFGVGEWVTRQDLALMLMRYAEFADYKREIDFGRADDFIDYYDIDYYAWEAVTWAATWRIMIGKGAPDAPKSERRIEPHTAATRTDYLEMLERMYEVNEVSGTPVLAEDPNRPANPTKITFKKGDGSVKLSWDAVDGAEKYAVCVSADGSWQILGRCSGTSYTLKKLKAGTEYKVSVIAMFGGRWNNDFGNAITVTPNPHSPAPRVTATEYSEQYHQFRIKWTAAQNAQQYGIAVKLAGRWRVQAYTNADTRTFTSPKLTAGKTYEMAVCAKIGDSWDLSNLSARTFTVTIK